MMTALTQAQRDVRKKHLHITWEYVQPMLNRTWPNDTNSPIEDLCIWTVSSTTNSDILMLSVGLESVFTRNTFSADENYPWLITSGAISSRKLKRDIEVYWDEMLARHPMHQKTCPFMVYELVDGQREELRDLNVDDKCIRVKIKDTTIWCHPPRFEVLEAVIKESSKTEFKNAEGEFLNSVKKLQKVDSNKKIPESVRNERKETCKTFMKQSFKEFYSYFEKLEWNDDRKYTSYRYPSLQLEVNKKYPDPNPTDNDKIRYGGTFSGVYGKNANEVHHEFTVQGTESVPMPTEEEIWNWLAQRHQDISLGAYSDVFNNAASEETNVAVDQEGQP